MLATNKKQRTDSEKNKAFLREYLNENPGSPTEKVIEFLLSKGSSAGLVYDWRKAGLFRGERQKLRTTLWWNAGDFRPPAEPPMKVEEAVLFRVPDVSLLEKMPHTVRVHTAGDFCKVATGEKERRVRKASIQSSLGTLSELSLLG